MNKKYELVSTENQTPDDIYKDRSWIRRLCAITFECSLCGGKHSADQYISLPASNIDEYAVALEKFTTQSESSYYIIANSIINYHSSIGDYDKLIIKQRENGVYTVSPMLQVEMLEESEYTCDLCKNTFDTIQSLRAHVSKCK